MNIVYNEQGDTFFAKKNLLGMTIEQEEKALNAMYENQLIFRVGGNTNKLRIISILHPVVKIVLPNTDNLDIQNLFNVMTYVDRSHPEHNNYFKELSSITLPSCLKIFSLRETFLWSSLLHTIFCYDTTELDLEPLNGRSNLKMIIVNSVDDKKKPRIIRL